MMGFARRARSSRKSLVSVAVAVSFMLVLTAVASASSHSAVWSGVGQVLFVGPSQLPGEPTSAESTFNFKRNGSIRSVEIETTNEFVMGVLAGGPGGSAITHCADRKKSGACENLDSLLTGATVTSLHTSKATLRKVVEGSLTLPSGDMVATLSGKIRGRLEGEFTISHVDPGLGVTGAATGAVSLRIGAGSTATYACFLDFGGGPLPLPVLDPCIAEGAGGQLFPIALDVKDKGKFDIGEGNGTLSEILGLKGKVEVNAQTNLFAGQFGGTIVIPRAKATLTGGDEVPDDRHRGRGDDDEPEDDEDEDEDED